MKRWFPGIFFALLFLANGVEYQMSGEDEELPGIRDEINPDSDD